MTQQHAVWPGKDGLRKTKAHLELNLARDVNSNRKGFHRDISNKRKTRENMVPLLNWAGGLVSKDTEVAEVPHVFFTSMFADKTCPQ